MLPLPADPGPLSQRLFHYRRGIYENLEVTTFHLRQPSPEAFEAFLKDIVIVFYPLCEDRDSAVALELKFC